MNKEEILQQKLESIKNDNWNIPSGTDTYSLCLDMMDNIGSILIKMF